LIPNMPDKWLVPIMQAFEQIIRNGPRKLDSALSEIFLGFQAANLTLACS
jgi:hypothetical protein